MDEQESNGDRVTPVGLSARFSRPFPVGRPGYLASHALRIEPTRLDAISERLADVLADVTRCSTQLGQRLHPATARGLAEPLRITNSYYSNLIEGNVTRPRDIERALAEQLDDDRLARDLQREAAAHVRVQREIDARHAGGDLQEPDSTEFIRWIHRSFYEDAPMSMLRVECSDGSSYQMTPGAFRSEPSHDNVVGRQPDGFPLSGIDSPHPSNIVLETPSNYVCTLTQRLVDEIERASELV